MESAMRLKHMESEEVALRMKGATRTIERSGRGVLQHVVETDTPAAILRWPTAYGECPPKVRYGSLPDYSAGNSGVEQ